MSKLIAAIKGKLNPSPTMATAKKATATINGKVIAEADAWQEVEGNIYVSLTKKLRKLQSNSHFPQFPFS